MRTEDGEDGEPTIVDIDERPPDDGPLLAIGDSVDRFVILSVIGEGGAGRVYAAYDPELDRQIALKLLKGSAGMDEHTEIARVRREAQALAKLTHPNVVGVYDVGEHEGRVYVAMEYVSGQTLRRWAGSERPAWPEVVEAFVAAGQGLLAVHEAGLVHRDVKPDNIMRGSDGRVRVMDFGLAREGLAVSPAPEGDARALTGSTTLTRTGAVAGTPAYMAPEQHLGQPFDARTDQFALCVSLWETLYGERPFAGANLAVLAYNVTQGIRKAAPTDTAVPAWVRRVLERGLAVDPADRWPSLAALLDALRQDDPSLRRRRALVRVLSATLALGLGVWAWRAGQTSMPAPPCADVETFDAVWHASRAPELDRAFERGGSPLAASASERVSEGLDQFARQWNAARRDTCEATHVRHEQSAALMDLRISCLDRRRARVAGIVEVLMQADAELVRDAPEIIAKLEPLDACADADRLRNVTPLPTDPEVVAAIEALSVRLETLAAQSDTGHQTSELLSEVRELAAEAEATGYAPLRVDAGLLVADIEETQAGPEQSLVTTRAAYYLALQEDLRYRAAFAAVDMLWRTSFADPLAPSLAIWSDHARVLVSRAEPTGPLEARRLINEGIIAWTAGELARAVELTRVAIPIAERSLGPRSATVADYRNNLGYMMMLSGDYEQAQQQFEFALQVWGERLGADHPRLCVANLSLAEVAIEQGRLDDARALAQRGLALTEAAGEGEGINAAYALNVLADLDRRAGRFERAREGHERALAITGAKVGPDHWRSALALAGLGQVALQANQLETALTQLTAAAQSFEPLGANRRDHGRALFGLARTEAARGALDVARTHAERARERFVEIGPRGEQDLREVDAWLADLAPAREHLGEGL